MCPFPKTCILEAHTYNNVHIDYHTYCTVHTMLYVSHMYSTVYMPFTVSPILCIACLCILRHSLQICTLRALNVIHSVSTSEKMDRLVHISLTSCQRTLCNSRRVKELERFSWMLLVNYTNFLCIPTMQNRQRYSNAINGRLIAIQG